MTFQPLHSRHAFAAHKPPVAEPMRRARLAPGLRGWAVASLGHEPPLDREAPSPLAPRHALSIRWLGACVLTGLAGALLLGSAIYVSSRGQITFAEIAELAAAPRGGEPGAGMRKGDKLVRAETVAAAKQTFKAPMTLRSGDRERIVTRSFTRIATGLSLTSGVYATNIPPFNPMRFFASAEPERAAEAPTETIDADVSVVKRDLSTVVAEMNGPTLSDRDAIAQIEAEAQSNEAAGRSTALPLLPTTLLPRVMGAGDPTPAVGLFPRATDAPFKSIEVRVVPENVTDLPKSAGRGGELAFEDRTVTIKRGDTLDALLRANGAGPEDARTIASVLTRDRNGTPVDGLQLRLLLAPAEAPGGARSIVRATIYGERGPEAITAMNDRRAFVSVALPSTEAAAPQAKGGENDDDEDDNEGTGARLYDSLYETALKQDIPRQTVEDLVRIFGYDVDFTRRVQPGDSFELFSTTDEEGGAERLEILSATLTLGNDVRRVFRYQSEDGSFDYFDEAGRSLKKFLLRKPITEARITSPFGSRFHPILGYSKTHTGVDWGAKIGTPVLAAGNGTVVKADWAGGYGRRTEIQHANGYVTAYNHQSAFGRGIAPGARVRQGQVIGFVGTTGLSTGPHLHYEVIINGRFVDPMKIRVPRGRELDGRALAEFSRQRDQIESLLKRAGTANQLAASDVR